MSHNKLSKYYKKKIIKCFALELTVTQTAKLLKINRNTVNHYYRIIRESIAIYEDHLVHQFAGEIELDESYFGVVIKEISVEVQKAKYRFLVYSSVTVLSILRLSQMYLREH